jgi:uncharacterized protein YjbI with pentapeptide repeats
MVAPVRLRDRNGNTRLSVTPEGGDLGSAWCDLLDHLNCSSIGTHDLDFRQAHIVGSFYVHGIDFARGDFSRAVMARGTVSECMFANSLFIGTRFHYRGAGNEYNERSLGTCFVGCTFNGARLEGCDFVMSTLVGCSFRGAILKNCDFRNVSWVDPHMHASAWDDLDEVPDPFAGASLINCRFGHPVGNMLNVSPSRMIPRSFTSVWNHMSDSKRLLTRFAYLMAEDAEDNFKSNL